MSDARTEARLEVVKVQIAHEVAHDLDPLVATFGDNAEWHNKTGGDVLRGHGGDPRILCGAVPGVRDFDILVHERHIATEAIVLETNITGTHLGDYMGRAEGQHRPADPRATLCHLHVYRRRSSQDEIVYYDQLSLLSQLDVITVP